MKVLVVGAGAVGSWLGGRLHLAGATVTLVARGAHAAAMESAGLRLEAGTQASVVCPRVVAGVEQAAPYGPHDVALITTKSYDTRAVAVELQAAGAPEHIVTFQNGVGNESVLAEILPASSIVPGTLTIGVHVQSPGVVRAWHGGGIGLAPAAGGKDSGLMRALIAAGFSVRTYDRGAEMKWSKLLLNMLGTASAAILAWPPPRVLADRRLFDLERSAWREALRVMRALGLRAVDLPGYRVRRMALLGRWAPAAFMYPYVHRRMADVRGQRLPSVASDLARGRPRTEIEVLNGAVARLGGDAAVPTPVNLALTSLVRALATGKLDRSAYAGQPDVLLRYVRSCVT